MQHEVAEFVDCAGNAPLDRDALPNIDGNGRSPVFVDLVPPVAILVGLSRAGDPV